MFSLCSQFLKISQLPKANLKSNHFHFINLSIKVIENFFKWHHCLWRTDKIFKYIRNFRKITLHPFNRLVFFGDDVWLKFSKSNKFMTMANPSLSKFL